MDIIIDTYFYFILKYIKYTRNYASGTQNNKRFVTIKHNKTVKKKKGITFNNCFPQGRINCKDVLFKCMWHLYHSWDTKKNLGNCNIMHKPNLSFQF